MVDVDTFLTTLYVIVDDFYQSHCSKERRRPGPEASLSPSEIVTLAIFSRWSCFQKRAGFLPLCDQASAGGLPYLAPPLAVQPAGA
jgi:hypothetical protein